MLYYKSSKGLSRKGVDEMENNEMTSDEFKTFIEMIIVIIESSKDKEEALEKIKNLTIVKKTTK